MEETIRMIIATQLGVEVPEVTDEKMVADDLGADSLDAVELVMALEEEFEVEMPDDDCVALAGMTVGQVITKMKELTQ